MTIRTKDPNSTLDWTFDWSVWLDSGETITGHSVTTSGSLTLVQSSLGAAGTKVTAWVSGGTLGERTDITCHIHTSAGRDEDWTQRLLIKQQ